MINLSDLDLIISSRPLNEENIRKKSKSVSLQPNKCSAFGTSCRKVSKFDVVDPLNCTLITPGPGTYKDPNRYSKQTKYQMTNFEKLEEQYNTQKYFEDTSAKISFKRPNKRLPENLNTTHISEPSISFPKVTAERKLWEPKNYYHPYKMPETSNPGPGHYEKHWVPVYAEQTNWAFKSTKEKFDDIVPRIVGPGSYSLENQKKLPNCENFWCKAKRNTKIKYDDSVIDNPAPADYSPYVPPNAHSSTYVFNSATKRGCQTMPGESVGVGAYNIDKKELHPVSFAQTERTKFEYFKGKPGVGPAHYVNGGKSSARAASFDHYSERFYPTDKSGVYIIPEMEDDREVIIKEKVVVKKKNIRPFNASEDRFPSSRDNWVKKKVAPDPGHYSPKLEKNLGFSGSKSPRFKEPKPTAPGPGNYDTNSSPLRPVGIKEFLSMA